MKQTAKKRPAKRREKGAATIAPPTATATPKKAPPKAPAKTPVVANKKAATVAKNKVTAPKSTRVSTPNPILPRTYGYETLFLIAQDPHWLFTYWDIDISRHPGGQTFLRCYHSNQKIEKEIEVPFETRNWYIPVSAAGAKYHVELGYYRGTNWNAIAVSEPVETPPDNLSESENFDFATVPLHLSFTKLMESIQLSIESGESLVSALSRLQRDGKLLPLQTSDFANLGSDERMVLESLLGRDFVSSFGNSSLSSHELQELIRKRLEERLNSETGGSEWLSSWGSAKAESSLFGILQTLAGPTSWSTGALSSWAAAALMSWAAAARGVSSWGGGAEATAAGASSSWGPESLTSWLQAAASSWTQAALSSWTQEAITSWTSGETSSWSGQPFGGSRDFFMHVNAELIFYGGTHPQASVTIDGKTVKLAPDGSFRYHFVFPNGDYEIPIVATSPDGVETRRAFLRFERETGKSGVVTDTPQPPLSAPMGRVA